MPQDSATHSPGFRNLVHAGAFVLFALPLGLLVDPRNQVPHGQKWVVAIIVLITVVNMVVLPLVPSGKLIARPGEGFVTGQWLYPFALAICFLVYPPFAAMGAWAAMAAGDAAASFAGRSIPSPRLPWNKEKSWSGLVGFLCAALPVCMFAMWWCPSQQFLTSAKTPEWPFVWTLGVLAAVSGALLESFDGPLDDNLRVPIGVGGVLWLAGGFLSYSTRTLPYSTHVQPEFFIHALIVNGALGLTVVLLRFADVTGTLLGVSIGAVAYYFSTWRGYLLFFTFVVIGSALSKVGLKKKQAIGAAEAREGKRGISNVAANLLVPAICCLAYPASGGNPVFLIAYAGAIAAAFADTASSEIGALAGGEPLLITTFKPVPHGTNGAVTLLGFVAATAASLLIALISWKSGFFTLIFPKVEPLVASCIVIAAGLAGTMVDSLFGATIEDKWAGAGKGTVNFACTLSGALTAGLASWLYLPY